MKRNRKQIQKWTGQMVAVLLIIVAIGMVEKTTVYAYVQTTGTVASTSANIRESASTTAKILASVVKNDVLTISDEVTGTDGNLWYHVFIDANTKGYVAASLIIKKGDTAPVSGTASTTTTTTSTTTTTPATTTVAGTPILPQEEWKSATLITDSVRVRADASTSSAILATVTKGVVVTVTGSKTGTDGLTWNQVSFSVDGKEYLGFIRSDFLSDEAQTTDSNVTQVDGTINEADTDVNYDASGSPLVDSAQPEVVTPTPTPVVEKPAKEYVLLNTTDTVSVPGGYIEVTISTDNGEISAYKYNDFYIFYATNSEGVSGWYRFDSQNNVYQRYDPLESGDSGAADGNSLQKTIIYILAGALIILFIVVVFLIIRLSDIKTEMEFGQQEDEEEDDELEPSEMDQILRKQRENARLVKDLEDALHKELKNEKRIDKADTREMGSKPRETQATRIEEDEWDEDFDFINIED